MWITMGPDIREEMPLKNNQPTKKNNLMPFWSCMGEHPPGEMKRKDHTTLFRRELQKGLEVWEACISDRDFELN